MATILDLAGRQDLGGLHHWGICEHGDLKPGLRAAR
jgi:hypothetical protein